MSIRRSIISFIMLLTYTVSFAHDIIPHCHPDSSLISGVEFEHQEHEHGHQHVSVDHSDESLLVQHIDHTDNGLIDFVICLFESVEHGSSSDQELIFSTNDQFQSSQELGLKSLSTEGLRLHAFELFDSKNQYVVSTYFKKQFVPLPVLSDCSILRGPPSFSC